MKLGNVLMFSAVVFFAVEIAPARAQSRARQPQAAAGPLHAVCVLSAVNKSGVAGRIFFEQNGNRVHISGKITGLTPGKHGFHVHQYGDLTSEKDGESAGGHFNPHHMMHGAPDAQTRHVGDLGNVDANAEGEATIDDYDSVIQLTGPDSIIGRSIIVHAGADKFVQPTGGAGGRVAFGVIGWANPKDK